MIKKQKNFWGRVAMLALFMLGSFWSVAGADISGSVTPNDDPGLMVQLHPKGEFSLADVRYYGPLNTGYSFSASKFPSGVSVFSINVEAPLGLDALFIKDGANATCPAPGTGTQVYDVADNGGVNFIACWLVSTSANAGGSVSDSQLIKHNTSAAIIISPNAGYTATVGGTCGGSPTSGASQFTYATNAISGPCTVSVSFASTTYTVTPSAGAGGSISPSTPQTVASGQIASFVVTPNAGYTATVGGTCVGSPTSGASQFTYATNAITGNCTVSVSFALTTYTVTPSAGAGGSISPSTPQTVAGGQTKSFTVTPSPGYTAVMGGTCGGSPSSGASAFTYTTNLITGDCTVMANFTQVPTYTVTPSAGTGGSISPSSPQTVISGQTTSFNVTPNVGYNVSSVNGCGGAWTGSNPYVTGTITSNCNVSATFTPQGVPGEVQITQDISYNSATIYTFTIAAGATQYFTCTLPAGETSSILVVPSLSQNTDIDVYTVQGTSTLTSSSADTYYNDFLAIYARYGWGYAIHLPNSAFATVSPPLALRTPASAPLAWARMGANTNGESIILKQGVTNSDNTVTSLPGKYYIAVKNKGTATNTYRVGWGRY